VGWAIGVVTETGVTSCEDDFDAVNTGDEHILKASFHEVAVTVKRRFRAEATTGIKHDASCGKLTCAPLEGTH
jgi:H2-forming N5,N10-methylenetetrahydromethanopterin dehydrogenase-like enzyme